jgi:uncharacterized protein YodC (DUF2158 family)
MQFEIGDIVRLKIGGPEMTVEAVDLRTAEVQCTWLVGNLLHRSRFKSLAVRKATLTPPKLELSALLRNASAQMRRAQRRRTSYAPLGRASR